MSCSISSLFSDFTNLLRIRKGIYLKLLSSLNNPWSHLISRQTFRAITLNFLKPMSFLCLISLFWETPSLSPKKYVLFSSEGTRKCWNITTLENVSTCESSKPPRAKPATVLVFTSLGLTSIYFRHISNFFDSYWWFLLYVIKSIIKLI